MTDTETTETTGAVPVVRVVNEKAPKRVLQMSLGVGAGIILAVIVLGFLGGLVAQGLFPAAHGPAGHIGKTGKQGAVGPIGPTGSAANVNLAAEGLCFNTTYYTPLDGVTPSLVTGAYLTTPTVTNGTKSCPTGSFVPLEPSPGAAPTQ
jgi:hypothetical protein